MPIIEKIRRNKLLFRVAILIFCLAFGIKLLQLIIPSILGSNLGITFIGAEPYPYRVSEPTITFKIEGFTEKQTIGTDFGYGLNVAADEISLPPIGKYSDKKICVSQLVIAGTQVFFPQPYITQMGGAFCLGEGCDRSASIYEFTDFCTKNETNTIWLRFENSDFVKTSSHPVIVSELSPYYFPFDKREVRIRVYLNAYEEDSNGIKTSITIAPDVVGWISTDGWDKNSSTEKTVVNQKPYTLVRIIFLRFLSLRMLSLITVIVLTIVIVSTVFIKEVSTFLEVSIGILLGMWGIQQMLIPEYVTWITIINQVMLLLYVMIGLSVGVRFLLIPLWN